MYQYINLYIDISTIMPWPVRKFWFCLFAHLSWPEWCCFLITRPPGILAELSTLLSQNLNKNAKLKKSLIFGSSNIFALHYILEWSARQIWCIFKAQISAKLTAWVLKLWNLCQIEIRMKIHLSVVASVIPLDLSVSSQIMCWMCRHM